MKVKTLIPNWIAATTSSSAPAKAAAKVSQATAKTTPSEPDVAFPAVLKGSQKQRVPPPVPPRGSPKTKRGGAHSQASSHDTKGDYQNLFFTVNDLPEPYRTNDDDFYFYGHDLKYSDSVACRTPPSISAHTYQMPKLEASNSFLGYVQEGDVLKEIPPPKGLVAQSNMMANFNINDAIREHLDAGEYDGDSFTDSSSDEFIVVHEIKEDNKVVVNTTTISLLKPTRQDTFQTEDSQSLDTLDSPKMKLNVPKPAPKPKSTPKTQGLMSRINTLKRNLSKKENNDESEKPSERNNTRGGLISGLTKKFIFNQAKKDRNTKTTPKIEIKPYTEEHCVEEAKKEQEVCMMKARSNIDLFQRQIYKTQSETEINSVISSRESLSVKRNVENRQFVTERKKMFENSPQSQAPNNRIPKRPAPSRKGRAPPPPPPRIKPQPQSLVSERISKFTVTRVPEPNPPIRTPRAGIKENRASFKRKLDNRKIYVMQKEFEEIL
ncbi:uncharacterized protein LOC121736347 [Aricia agestis]|uniref:uncharacterized protein LOC121736347 n=1 Tax=Aricia agestis TaxID=91739 RepID=UPI001C2068A0|nr:uncharacterized protein LOC121736347 [Aricia agestis]